MEEVAGPFLRTMICPNCPSTIAHGHKASAFHPWLCGSHEKWGQNKGRDDRDADWAVRPKGLPGARLQRPKWTLGSATWACGHGKSWAPWTLAPSGARSHDGTERVWNPLLLRPSRPILAPVRPRWTKTAQTGFIF